MAPYLSFISWCTFAGIFLCLGSSGCAQDREQEVGREWYPTTDTSHFRFFNVGAVSEETMTKVALALEAESPSILRSLNIGHETHGEDVLFTNPVKVILWNNQREFAKAWGTTEVPGGVANFAGGYIHKSPEGQEIHLFDRGSRSARDVVHEYAHLATLVIEPGLGHNPTWLWEGVAQYLVGEKPDVSSLSCFANNSAPSMAEINEFPGSLVYNSVSYFLVEYIVDQFGMDRLLALIRANGDSNQVLNVAQAKMHSDWVKWMRSTYEFRDPVALTSEELMEEMTNNTFDLKDLNSSSFQRDDGIMLVGNNGSVSMTAKWGIKPDGIVYVEMPRGPQRLSKWYRIDDSHYQMARLEKDCLFYDYQRRIGNPERL